jgi:hypothetical protein
VDNSTEPRDFEIESPKEAAASDGNSDGGVEEWKPIQLGPRDFDIQSPDGQASQTIYAGYVGTWVQVSTEKTRRTVAFCIVGLFAAWVLLGLIVFAVAGNVWLLCGAGVLAVPLKYVLGYYFRHSKK